MANKAFGIQGADLTLGGLNLQAGTNGVVIPGVTRAASYRVEEIKETGEQTNTLNLPIVIDNVTHTVKVADPSASTLAYATYTVELDDEDYVDEVEVNIPGTYVGSEVDRNGDFDMWGYIGSDAEGYLSNWVTSDWVQIPFRPKMRAADVELEGGGGGSLTVGNGTDPSIQNVSEILINGQITQEDDGVVSINILSGNGLTDITGAQVGNQITINTTVDGTTPDLSDASSINYIPTTTLLANDWIGSGTNDPGTYPTVRFADGSTFVINGWNTDAYPDTGNGTSGFISLDVGGLFYTGAQVWPITITSYNYVAGTTAGRGIEVDGNVWKFDESAILTVPGEIQSRGLDNLVLRSKDNINLYAGQVPGDDSEGGDINIYAGKGDPDNGGGDVQIRGGEGGDLSGPFNTGNDGGSVQLRGGYSIGASNGGYVDLRAGASDRGKGGDVRIYGGFGSDGMLKLDNVAITDITLSTPVLVTLAVDHNLNYGDAINFADITTTTQLNNTKYYVIVASNNTITLFQNRELTIPVSGVGMTPYSSPGTLTVTATSANAQSSNLFAQFLSNVPEIGNVQVGWTVTGPGLNGTKTVTAVDPANPVVITVDGSDGSVFNEFQSYTFTEPTTTGLGTAYTSAHGGDIILEPGSTSNSAWGDIGRTFIRGETQIGSDGGNIWKFGIIDGALTLPSGSPVLFGNGNSRIQAGMGFHINSEEGISLEAVDITDPLNPISRGWYFDTNGNINLPVGSIISETSSTISIAPPTAAAGQSLVVRPTAALWSVDSSGFISYGNPITISVTLSSFPYFGTINYEITGPGVTEQSLGRPTTGKLTFAGIPSIDTQTVTWTIPANSDITEFTFTITSVDGTRSNDIQIENDPALYYNFEFNALPVGYFVTVTNDNITNLEFSHVHLVAGDPATVDLYLGDDDQFVKIEKNGGNVVVGTNANTKNWTFGTDGTLTLPAGGDILNNVGNSVLLGDELVGTGVTGVGTTLTIANDSSGGLAGWSSTALAIAYNADIMNTYPVNSTITFQDGTTAIITGYDPYAPNYIDVFWDTPKTGTLFPITLKTSDYVAAVPFTASIIAADKQWTFTDNGRLTLPGGNTSIGNLFGSDGIISSPNATFGVISQGSGGFSGLQWLDAIVEPLNIAGIGVNSPYAPSTGSVQIYTGTVGIPPQNSWTFDPDGKLTLPGTLVKSTVAKTGGADAPTTSTIGSIVVGVGTTLTDNVPIYGYAANTPTGSATGPITALFFADDAVISPPPFTLLLLTPGIYTGFTVSSRGLIADNTNSHSFIVDGVSVLMTPEEVSPGANQYAYYARSGDVFGLATKDTQTLPVLVLYSDIPSTVTALDLTKSVQKLTAGKYSLADGVEGQIMYMVPQNGITNTSEVNVSVANYRTTDFTGTTGGLLPFRTTDSVTSINNTGMCTLIFTDGAWQQQGGLWD